MTLGSTRTGQMSNASASLSGRKSEGNLNDASWRKVGIAAPILAAILAALYWPILVGLMAQWWDDANYTHGFLVPLFSGFLVWGERARLTAVAPRGSLPGLAVLVGGIAILILGSIGS